MKKLLLLSGFMILLVGGICAQKDKAKSADQDYQSWLEDEKQMNFKSYVSEVLELTPEQLQRFNPVYDKYLNEQGELANKKAKYLAKYEEEMKEDDDAADEAEETADFIEDYWEVDIAQMELRKDYFDRMEDIIGWENAFAFFLLEEQARNRYVYTTIYRIIPRSREIDRASEKNYAPHKKDEHNYDSMKKDGAMKQDATKGKEGSMTKDATRKQDESMSKNESIRKDATAKNESKKQDEWMDKNKSTKKDASMKKDMSHAQTSTYGQTNPGAVSSYNNWCKTEGKMDVTHEFTYNGIKSLVDAMNYVGSVNGEVADTMQSRQKEIMDLAAQLKVDPNSDKHADIARKIFQRIAATFDDWRSLGTYGLTEDMTDEVVVAAELIDPEQPLRSQKEHVHHFFDVSGTVINTIADRQVAKDVEKQKSNK